MTELTARVRELRDANEQFLRAAARSAQETIAGMGPESGTYDSRGDSRGGTDSGSGARLFDKDL